MQKVWALLNYFTNYNNGSMVHAWQNIFWHELILHYAVRAPDKGRYTQCGWWCRKVSMRGDIALTSLKISCASWVIISTVSINTSVSGEKGEATTEWFTPPIWVNLSGTLKVHIFITISKLLVCLYLIVFLKIVSLLNVKNRVYVHF